MRRPDTVEVERMAGGAARLIERAACSGIARRDRSRSERSEGDEDEQLEGVGHVRSTLKGQMRFASSAIPGVRRSYSHVNAHGMAHASPQYCTAYGSRGPDNSRKEWTMKFNRIAGAFALLAVVGAQAHAQVDKTREQVRS